jgi:two-component system phosphate regulon sensor histidine kinase PhoR
MRALFSPFLIAISTLVSVACAFILLIQPEWISSYQTAAVVATIAATGGLAWFLNNKNLRGQLADLSRYVEALDRIDFSDAAAVEPESFCPNLKSAPQARAISQGVFDVISQYANQLHEMEQSLAGAEVRLRRTESEISGLRRVFDNLNEPIVAIDNFDEIVLANPSASALLSDGNPIRGAVQNLERCEALVQLLTETRRRRTTSQRVAEIEFATLEGDTTTFQVVCRNTYLDDGAQRENCGAVAVLSDISERKVMQRRHAEFVSAVSHEMKTPLAGIKAYVELLADGEAEDEATREEFLSVINSQADRLERLINNLLNLARIEAGVVQVDKRPQPVNELLEEAVQVVQPAAEKKNIELKAALSPLFLGILADRDMFLQAIINLLSNAVKYTPEDGTVVIRSRVEDESVIVDVQDSGAGLETDDCTRIFEKFYRVKANSNMAAGTGLGLPLARHIVCDVHSGEIWVDSKPGEGSTFHIRVPSHAYAETTTPAL